MTWYDNIVRTWKLLPALPNFERAVVDIRKLRDYCLNAAHPRGGADKARVFASVLGMTQEHAEILRDAILDAVQTEVAFALPADEYGQRYTVYFTVIGPNGNDAVVTTGWIVASGTDFPRLTTCYIETN